VCLDVINQTWSPLFGVCPTAATCLCSVLLTCFCLVSMRPCSLVAGTAPCSAISDSSPDIRFGIGANTCMDIVDRSPHDTTDNSLNRRFAELVNVFEVFLPQLLLYPNPTDPLNGEAAALMLREPDMYKAKVRGTFAAYLMSGELNIYLRMSQATHLCADMRR
jgi:ubiquitin-protein ligase